MTGGEVIPRRVECMQEPRPKLPHATLSPNGERGSRRPQATLAPVNCTLTRVETPGSCMVIP